MVGKIKEYYAKYEMAEKDPELLETFWAMWGDRKEQACTNMRKYDMYQECGYTDEPRFDRRKTLYAVYKRCERGAFRLVQAVRHAYRMPHGTDAVCCQRH